jgi:hypothetical protein
MADESTVLSGEDMATMIGQKIDELADEAAEALSAARDGYDYAEAAVAANTLAALLRVRQRVWELQP